MKNLEIVLALVVVVPMLGALLSYIVGRILPSLAGLVASLAVALAFVCSVILFQGVSQQSTITTELTSWMSFGSLRLPLELFFDRLSAVMCLIITGIGTLIHIYSIGYMSHDEGQPRFFAYLNLFVAAMLVLVLGKSLPVVFIGWEGVGLCSYLLIGFWFTNSDYAKAGRKAFVMNRIGDVGFLVAMAVLFVACGTLDIPELAKSESLSKLPADLGFIAGLALFFAATGKSAQIPLFTWLPDAMAGPTPVSALIHAATMVTAGVYLMGRMHGVVELTPMVPAIIMWTAIATALIAALTALVQNDIKKVLAYSTVSQLGFMFLAVGAGSYSVALFHVVTHAFFKACLFLSAGSVIHGCHHEQDMSRMGGLATRMPLTCLSYGLATLAIAGIAPLSGYYSKHAILGAVAANQNPYLLPYTWVLSATALAIAICTAFYMTRSFVLTFLGTYRGSEHPHEAPTTMTVPVLALAALSIVGGWLLQHGFLSYLSGTLPSAGIHDDARGIIGLVTGSLPGIAGVVAAYIVFTQAPSIRDNMRRLLWPFEKICSGRFFVDELYERAVVGPIQLLSRVSSKIINQTFVEGSGSALGGITRAVGELACRMTTGQVATYVLIMFASAAVLFSLFVQVR